MQKSKIYHILAENEKTLEEIKDHLTNIDSYLGQNPMPVFALAGFTEKSCEKLGELKREYLIKIQELIIEVNKEYERELK